MGQTVSTASTTLATLDKIISTHISCCPKRCLPSIGGSRNKKEFLSGLNYHVRLYADNSKFWHAVWASEGKPIWGSSFDNMKYSKNQYKVAVRRLKGNQRQK